MKYKRALPLVGLLILIMPSGAYSQWLPKLRVDNLQSCNTFDSDVDGVFSCGDYSLGDACNDGCSTDQPMTITNNLTANSVTVLGAASIAGVTSHGAEVNMNDNEIIDVGWIDFNLINGIECVEGRLSWNDDEGTLNLGMKGGVVNQQVGLEVMIRVKNTSGSTIVNGAAVRISGATGSNPTIDLADADDPTAAGSIGLATEEIENNQFGYVTDFGLVRELDTDSYDAGDRVYVSNTPGGLTGTPPTGTERVIFMGIVVRKHTDEGILFISPINVSYLSELSGNLITIPLDRQSLLYNTDTGLWVNETLTGEYIPVIIPTETLDEFIKDTTMNCVMDAITVTDEGGLDISWTAGEAWADSTIIEVDASTENYTLNDNATSYLSAIGSTSTLQISNSEPVPPSEHTIVATIYTYDGDIEYALTEPLCDDQVETTHDSLDDILSEIVTNGLLVAVDLDGTNANDFIIGTGAYYLHAHHKTTITTTLYSSGSTRGSDNTSRYYHSGGTWTSETSNGVDYGFWDDGTNKDTTQAGKWYSAGIFIEGNGEIDYVYPQTEYSTQSGALLDPLTYPPYHQGFVIPLARFVFRGGTTAFDGSAYFVDIRPIILGTGGGGGTTPFLWATFNADSGTATADDTADAFDILGGTGIETTITGDALTITHDIITPSKVDADPCGTYAESTIFYNDTSNYMCFCDGTNDVQMHDPTTACF